MRLFIAEKPSLAKAIFEGLGGNPTTEKKNGYFQHGNDAVTWCFGHMLELSDPDDYDEKYRKWRFSDLPIQTTYPPTYKIKRDSEAQTRIILSLIEQASSIVHAGDPDEEGCLLVDEILGYANNKKPVERLLVSDLNLAPVQKALTNMQLMKSGDKFSGMTNSALSRSLLDQSFGYNLTRGCTLKGQEKGYVGVLNVGRVQSAVLGLVNQRTLSNQSHTESFYYDVFAALAINGHMVKAKYQTTDSDQIDDKKRLISDAQSRHIVERVSGKDVVVTIAATKPENTKPPLPLDLSTLQVICAKRYGYKSQETLEIMQGLYETHKLVTYPRTDNRYLSDEHFYQAGDIAAAVCATMPELATATAGMDKEQKHRAFNADEIGAHHAIVPTTKNGAGIQLNEKEKNVYRLVANHYIGLFWPDAIRNKTKVHFDIKGDTFTATQSVLVQKGWEALGKDEAEDKEAEDNTATGFDLSELKFNDNGLCESALVDKKPALPPKYFTESTLISAMKNPGKFIDDPDLRKALEAKEGGGTLGTEATRAGILEKLAANTGLISLEKEKGYSELVWKTTKQGQEYCAALPSEVIKPDISARWAEKQAQIKSGELTVSSFIKETDEYISNLINYLDKNGVNISSNAAACPVCSKGFLRNRKGQNGIFWGCSCYPECKATFPDKNGKPVTEKKEEKPKLSLSCPNCSSALNLGEKAVNCTGGCGFVLWRTISAKKLTDSQIQSLITKKSTDFISGFVNKKGEKYAAKLHLTDEHKIKFEYKPK